MGEQRKKSEIAPVTRTEPNWLFVLRGEWEAEPLAHSWQHPLMTGVAAVLALVLARALHLRDVYWAAISAVVVMQPEAVLTISASRDRVLGTAVGAAMGWLAALIWHGNVLVFGLAVVISLTACHALGLKNASRLCGATICLVALVPAEGPKWRLALDRFVVVSFGIVIAVAISLVLDRWVKFRERRPRAGGGELQ
jgi:uncharacterized membrane protein YgaE (UPF0421/DUF939 family)